MLEVKDLRVLFPDRRATVLDGVSLSVTAGECVAIGGDNGSGKSTLAKTLIGVIPKLVPANVAGDIQWQARSLLQTPISERLGIFGYTFQDIESQVLFGTVWEVLGLEEQNGLSGLLSEAISCLKVKKLLHRMPDELSGGQAQKVALLTALRRNPPVVMFDEAIAALDPSARKEFRELISCITARNKITVLIGQDVGQFSELSNHTFVLSKGRFVTEHQAFPPVNIERAKAFWIEIMALYSGRIYRPPGVSIEKLVMRRKGRYEFTMGPVNFTAYPGEVVSLVGPNGSGKSTFMEWLAGGLKAHEGTVRINGEALSKINELRKKITVTFVQQNPARHILGYDVLEEIEHSLPAAGMERRNVLELLEANFGFLEFDKDPLSLSFGQQKMLKFLSSALVFANVLIVDEPEQGVDSNNLQYFKALVGVNRERRFSTIIFATHDLRLAAQLSDRIVLISDGQIVGETRTCNEKDVDSWYFETLS